MLLLDLINVNMINYESSMNRYTSLFNPFDKLRINAEQSRSINLTQTLLRVFVIPHGT